MWVNVISKSGQAPEPAIAFRVFREYLEHRYGKQEAQKRIYCTTDRSRGTLHDLAVREGYERFVIPDDVGGRYSVLTPVGLLPIAVSGGDIQALMDGAATAREEFRPGFWRQQLHPLRGYPQPFLPQRAKGGNAGQLRPQLFP